jgi:hypothetical protein
MQTEIVLGEGGERGAGAVNSSKNNAAKVYSFTNDCVELC